MDAGEFKYGSQFCRCQIDGILNDCIDVYKKVLGSGVRLNNNENEIRDEFAKYLQDDNYKYAHTSVVKNFHVDTEVREGDHGRIDIRFLRINPYKSQKMYYGVECKRLDGGSTLNNEYVKNGIRRFISPDKYTTPTGFNAMIGFMVKHFNITNVCDKINKNLSAKECLSVIYSNDIERYWKFESKHQSSEKITLLHLWLDCSNVVIG